MFKGILLILILIVDYPSLAQKKDSLFTRRFGFIYGVDLVYNNPDKLLNAGLSRRIQFGACYTNKQRSFMMFGNIGFKGVKLNAYSSTLQNSFIEDVQRNYQPIQGGGLDSLIAAKVNANPGKSMHGSYAQYYHIGLMLNKKMKPTIGFYSGNEQFLLFHSPFTKYVDPEYQDIHYVIMPSKYYEIKLGCGLPMKGFWELPMLINFNIGYKWVDYGAITFHKTPLSKYTTNNLADKYNHNGKLTYSITFLSWTNWDF